MAASNLCPSPFLDLADFPYKGGQLQSRFCAPISPNTTCCLPCPVTDWVYPDNFNTIMTAANWVGMCSFVCCILLLLSFVVLPARATSRHYLTICLVAAVACLTFSFVISLGTRPQQCHDAITPNNMQSNLPCAFSGAFVLFGGMAGAVWVFIRSLSLHLQICWQIVPGRKFFYSALVGGWGIPILLVALSLSLSGVSYRFGPICHINHDYSLGAFWGPVLGFTGLAAICQFVTLGYCIRVYLRSLMDAGGATSATSSTAASTALPSVHGSIKPISARTAYRRVRKVIALQWRAMMVVIIVIASAAYFSVVFLKLDSATVATQEDPKAALPWLTCLVLNNGDKDECLDKVSNLILGEPTVATVLYLIAVMGFWCVLFLGRWSMLGAWCDLFRRPFVDNDNWVSADARRMSDPRNYEMLIAPPQQYHLAKGPSGLVATATILHKSNTLPSESKDETSYRASGNTARVAFSRDTPTPVPATVSPRSQPSAGYYTPQSYTSPSIRQGHTDYFSRTASGLGRQGEAQTFGYPAAHDIRDRERADSALSHDRKRSGSASERGWYGTDPRGSQQAAGRAGSQQASWGSLREWDPKSTFAQSSRPL